MSRTVSSSWLDDVPDPALRLRRRHPRQHATAGSGPAAKTRWMTRSCRSGRCGRGPRRRRAGGRCAAARPGRGRRPSGRRTRPTSGASDSVERGRARLAGRRSRTRVRGLRARAAERRCTGPRRRGVRALVRQCRSGRGRRPSSGVRERREQRGVRGQRCGSPTTLVEVVADLGRGTRSCRPPGPGPWSSQAASASVSVATRSAMSRSASLGRRGVQQALRARRHGAPVQRRRTSASSYRRALSMAMPGGAGQRGEHGLVLGGEVPVRASRSGRGCRTPRRGPARGRRGSCASAGGAAGKPTEDGCWHRSGMRSGYGSVISCPSTPLPSGRCPMRAASSSSMPDVDEGRQPAVRAENAERAVAGVDQPDGGLDDPPQRGVQVQARGDAEEGVEQVLHPLLGPRHGSQPVLHLVQQLGQPHAGEQAPRGQRCPRRRSSAWSVSCLPSARRARRWHRDQGWSTVRDRSALGSARDALVTGWRSVQRPGWRSAATRRASGVAGTAADPAIRAIRTATTHRSAAGGPRRESRVLEDARPRRRRSSTREGPTTVTLQPGPGDRVVLVDLEGDDRAAAGRLHLAAAAGRDEHLVAVGRRSAQAGWWAAQRP